MKFEAIIERKIYPSGNPYVSVFKNNSKGMLSLIGNYAPQIDGTFLVVRKRKPVKTEEEAIIQIIKAQIERAKKEILFLEKLIENPE